MDIHVLGFHPPPSSTTMSSTVRASGGSFSTDISPFFQSIPTLPTLPILLAHTELAKAPTPGALIGQQEIGPVRQKSGRSVHFTPYPKPSSKQSTRQSSPHHHSSPQVSGRSQRPVAREATPDSESDLTSISGSYESEQDEESDGLVLKPDGEAGRPGRGGYNLEEAMQWKGKDYKQFKVAPFSLRCSFKVVTALCRNLLRRLRDCTLTRQNVCRLNHSPT